MQINELPAAHAFQKAVGEGTDIGAAFKDAFQHDVKKRPHVKGKHVKSGSVSFILLDTKEED